MIIDCSHNGHSIIGFLGGGGNGSLATDPGSPDIISSKVKFLEEVILLRHAGHEFLTFGVHVPHKECPFSQRKIGARISSKHTGHAGMVIVLVLVVVVTDSADRFIWAVR